MAMIVVFLVWWQMMDRSIKSKEETGKMTELVKKQQEARGMGVGTDSSSVVESANAVDTLDRRNRGGPSADAAGEGAPPDTAAGSSPSGIAVGQPSGTAGGGEGTTGEKAVSDETSTATRDDAPAQEGIYYSVHVASFKEMSRAETEMEHLAEGRVRDASSRGRDQGRKMAPRVRGEVRGSGDGRKGPRRAARH